MDEIRIDMSAIHEAVNQLLLARDGLPGPEQFQAHGVRTGVAAEYHAAVVQTQHALETITADAAQVLAKYAGAIRAAAAEIAASDADLADEARALVGVLDGIVDAAENPSPTTPAGSSSGGSGGGGGRTVFQ